MNTEMGKAHPLRKRTCKYAQKYAIMFGHINLNKSFYAKAQDNSTKNTTLLHNYSNPSEMLI